MGIAARTGVLVRLSAFLRIQPAQLSSFLVGEPLACRLPLEFLESITLHDTLLPRRRGPRLPPSAECPLTLHPHGTGYRSESRPRPRPARSPAFLARSYASC